MLKDLKAVQGGIVAGSSHSAASNAGGNSDTDHYSDASPGVWTFDYRTWNI